VKEYFMGLLALCVCICIVELLSPSGEGEGIARHLKLLCALCLLGSLISPVLSLLQGDENLLDRVDELWEEWSEENENKREEYGDRWEEQCERIDVAYAEEAIAAMIAQNFSLERSEVRVEVVMSAQGTGIEEVRVALTGGAIWVNSHEVQDYLHTLLGCESSIWIE
jgi:hypothetical protein